MWSAIFRFTLNVLIFLLFVIVFDFRNGVAAPFIYDETISGDLPAALPSIAFPFDVGVNSIRGTVTLALNPTGTLLDTDSFRFSIPATTRLSDVSFSFSTSSVNVLFASVRYLIDFNFQPIDIALLGQSSISLNNIFGNLSPPQLVFGLDNIHPILVPPEIVLVEPPSFVTTYRWDFTVAGAAAAVAEPSSAYFLLSGAVLIGLSRAINDKVTRKRFSYFNCLYSMNP